MIGIPIDKPKKYKNIPYSVWDKAEIVIRKTEDTFRTVELQGETNHCNHLIEFSAAHSIRASNSANFILLTI